MRPDQRLLGIWAMACGLFLWAPAVAMPIFPIPLQPVDVLVVLGWPLIVMGWSRIAAPFIWILGPFLLSLVLTSIINPSQPLILIHALALILPFLTLVHIVAGNPNARRLLGIGFLWGAAGSALLFLAQFFIGAEALDFRTNTTFSLPPHYRRGFALMPEVSTFAAHMIIAIGLAICLVLHPLTPGRHRRGLGLLLVLFVVVLMLSRSTSFLVVAPLLCIFAITRSRKLDARSVLILIGFAIAMAVILVVFFNTLYSDRLENAAASRSISMRLASVLGGLSPLVQGDFFGVGLGQNHEIERRAYDVARDLGLSFGQLPKGVNSQIIARVFEEGWPAVIQFAIAATIMIRVWSVGKSDPNTALWITLSMGSFLCAFFVIGYRGIYTNWIWLAAPAALLGQVGSFQAPVRRSTAPIVRNNI